MELIRQSALAGDGRFDLPSRLLNMSKVPFPTRLPKTDATAFLLDWEAYIVKCNLLSLVPC